MNIKNPMNYMEVNMTLYLYFVFCSCLEIEYESPFNIPSFEMQKVKMFTDTELRFICQTGGISEQVVSNFPTS